MSSEEPSNLRQLVQLIDQYFSLAEFEGLALEWNINPENLAGDTKTRKIISFLLRLVREGGVVRLKDLLKQERPFVQWPDMPSEAILKSDFITLSVKGEYRNILDPETRYLTELIYDLSGREGPLEYVGLRGEVQVRGTGAKMSNKVDRKVVDSAFSVIEMGSKGRGTSGLDEQKKIPLENIREVVEKYPLFTLIGDPGAGKTTTLRRLALDAAWERLKNENAPIPLWRELPRWQDGQEREDFISKGWNLTLPLQVAIVNGDVALYLDGLNEMGAKSKDRANILKQWLNGKNHPKKAIVTCRAENYLELDLGITTVLVEELVEVKIRAFAKNYLAEKADAFLERVLPRDEWDKKEKRHLFHLARNPFMLRALIMIYTDLPDGDLPSNTGVVFRKLISFLWNREKERKTPYWVSYDEMLRELSILAFSMMEDGLATTVSLEYAQKYVALTTLQVADSANIVRIDADFVSFYHQSMQEYLAAAYIVTDIKVRASVKFFKHVTDAHWRNVFLMTAGLLDDTALFFELFLDALDEIIVQDAKTISFLAWANQKVNVMQQQAYKPVAVRGVYIWLALARSLDIARVIAYAFASERAFAYNFIDDLDRDLILNRDNDLKYICARAFDFARTLDTDLARTFDLDFESDLIVVFDHIFANARAIERYSDLDSVIDLNLTHDIELVCALDLDLPLVRARAIALDLALVFANALAHSFAFAYDHNFDFFLDRPNAYYSVLTNHIAYAKEVSKELNFLELHEKLSLLHLPDIENSRQMWLNFAQSLETIAAKYRQIQKWDLSGTELYNLDTYLLANELIVECLSLADVQDRKEIENRMLVPPK